MATSLPVRFVIEMLVFIALGIVTEMLEFVGLGEMENSFLPNTSSKPVLVPSNFARKISKIFPDV